MSQKNIIERRTVQSLGPFHLFQVCCVLMCASSVPATLQLDRAFRLNNNYDLESARYVGVVTRPKVNLCPKDSWLVRSWYRTLKKTQGVVGLSCLLWGTVARSSSHERNISERLGKCLSASLAARIVRIESCSVCSFGKHKNACGIPGLHLLQHMFLLVCFFSSAHTYIWCVYTL